MTRTEFKAARHRLRMTIDQLGRIIGAKPRTIRGYEAHPSRRSARPIPWWAISRVQRLEDCQPGVIKADGFKIRLRPPGIVMTESGVLVAWLDDAPEDPSQAQAIIDEVRAA